MQETKSKYGEDYDMPRILQTSVYVMFLFSFMIAPQAWGAIVKPEGRVNIKRVATIEERKFADVLSAIDKLSEVEQDQVSALIHSIHAQGGTRDQARDAVAGLLKQLGAGDLAVTQEDGRFELAHRSERVPGSTARLSFEVGAPSPVRISVYNVLGQEVRQLVEDTLQPGVYATSWDGEDEAGRSVKSGVYFVRMTADGFDRVKKVKIIRA